MTSVKLGCRVARTATVVPLLGIACLVASPWIQIIAGGHGAGTVAGFLREILAVGAWKTYDREWIFVLSAIFALSAIAALAWLAIAGRIPWGVRAVGAVSAFGGWLTPVLLSEEWFLTGATGCLGLIATIIVAWGFRFRAPSGGSSCRACGYPRPDSAVAVCPECGKPYGK